MKTIIKSSPATLCAILVLPLALLSTSAWAGVQAIENCDSPAIDIPGATNPNSTIIEFTEDREIDDISISVDITHAWVGDINLSIESPAGTSLDLHAGAGGDADDLIVNFTDSGIANAAPYDCNCDMQPSGGALSIFQGESSLGDWTLGFQDTFPSADDGILNSWCINILPADPLFRRGDVDSSGELHVNDAVMLLRYLFIGGAVVPLCLDAADFDDNGSLNLQDGTGLLNYMFMPGSPAPASPGAINCGVDASADALADCVHQDGC